MGDQDMDGTFGYFMNETNKRLDRIQTDQKESVEKIHDKLDQFSGRMDKRLEQISMDLRKHDGVVHDLAMLSETVERHETKIDILMQWKNYVLGGVAIVGIVVGYCAELTIKVLSHKF